MSSVIIMRRNASQCLIGRMPLLKAFSLDAAPLFQIAHSALLDLGGKNERSGGHSKALIAIVFSAISLEAFINELGQLCLAPFAQLPTEPSAIKVLGDLLEEVEANNGSLRFKFLTIGRVLGGPFDKGGRLYQGFSLLIDARNAIAHMKPSEDFEDETFKPSPLVHKFRALNVLALPEHKEAWPRKIATKAASRWAIDVTSAVVHSIIDITPQGKVKGLLDGYRDYFPPAPLDKATEGRS